MLSLGVKSLACTASSGYMASCWYDIMSEMFQIDRVGSRAYLMINCESGSEGHVLDEISTFPEIKECTLTIGRHDILALVEAETAEELGYIIASKIRRIPEIRCTTTLVCTKAGL